MVRYDDIKGVLSEYLINGRKHLFKIKNIQIEIWGRSDGRWRIVTDLSIADAQLVTRSLNDTLSDIDATKFYTEDAWADLSRPIYAIPKLTSQIVGYIPDIDTISRIWMAISKIEDIPRESAIFHQNPKWDMDMPKGHSIERILKRLSEGDIDTNHSNIKKSRKIIRKNFSDEEINAYIWELREEGKTYKQMIWLASKKFKQNITEHRIRKVIKAHKEVEEAIPEIINQLIIDLRRQNKTYKEMKSEVRRRYGEKISDYRIKKVLREAGLIGR